MDDTHLFCAHTNTSVFEGREWTIRTCFMQHTNTSVVCIFEVQIGPVFQRKTGPEWTMKCPSADVQIALVFCGGPSPPAGPRRLPEPNVCQAPSLERLRILSQKGCVHKSSGSAPILRKMGWTKRWLRIWLSSSKLLGRGPHKNCKNDLDDQT